MDAETRRKLTITEGILLRTVNNKYRSCNLAEKQLLDSELEYLTKRSVGESEEERIQRLRTIWEFKANNNLLKNFPALLFSCSFIERLNLSKNPFS